MEQFALCDVVMTQIKVSGGATHSFATADEISCEPVIEEGETKNLTIKNKLIASKQVPDMVLGLVKIMYLLLHYLQMYKAGQLLVVDHLQNILLLMLGLYQIQKLLIS